MNRTILRGRVLTFVSEPQSIDDAASYRYLEDGAITIQFGDCTRDIPNCLPVSSGWNYMVRLYRPRQEILDGTWSFPKALPAS